MRGRILVLAGLLIALGLLVAPAPALAQPAVTVSPSSGPVGTQFIITVTGFAPNTATAASVRGPGGREFASGEVTADASGTIRVSYDSSGDPAGQYTASFAGRGAAAATASATFTVTAGAGAQATSPAATATTPPAGAAAQVTSTPPAASTPTPRAGTTPTVATGTTPGTTPTVAPTPRTGTMPAMPRTGAGGQIAHNALTPGVQAGLGVIILAVLATGIARRRAA